MTKEDKNLLLTDLCARLPYGVNVQTKASGGSPTEGVLWSIEDSETGTFIFHKGSSLGYVINEDIIKPYLRPMFSMTEEERREYELTCSDWYETLETYDWLNAHHFDFRHLIERGLAIEAPEGMYNLKEK